MGNKDRNVTDSVSRKRKQRGNPLQFLGTQFDVLNEESVKHHLLLLVLVTIAMKFVVVFFTLTVFQSFIDYFDIGVYFNSATPLLQGQLPYVNYQLEYPILMFIPILLAFIPALLTQNPTIFALSFQFLMVLCDILIVLCIYFIGLKIYPEKTAFYAGLIYGTAFSTAYFIITKSDAFPTALLMLGILLTVYGMNVRGYASASAGFFTKMFPAIALPFMMLYNAKTTSLKVELISAGKIFLIFCIVLLLPLALISPATLSTYLFVTGGTVNIYVNTASYTLYAYLSEVLHWGISSSTVSSMMYVLMGITLLLLLYIAFAEQEKKAKTLLKLVLCAIFCSVFFTKFHSPQYIVWFTPLLALLVADNFVKIGLFYASQVFAYIEFPLMFGSFYTNLQYTSPVGSPDWYMTLFFFTFEHVILIVLLYFTIRPQEGIITKLKEYFQVSLKKQELSP
ncbi:MAG: hypothetical protein M0Q92_15215 [Methanoregula sp.]|jgi:hypothetical protein|nr:hypothetical protein [Methanoregula sp.]